jgi:hypothetical protein
MSDPNRGGSDPLHAAGHIEGCASGKREQQNALRVCVVYHEMGNAVGEGLGFARSRTGDHNQRLRIKRTTGVYIVLDGASLLPVQIG